MAKQAFDHYVTIHPYDDFVIDRSLDSSRFREATGYQPPSWGEMVEVLARSNELYENL
jgi:dTDP-4-dehydrorhamnose reductase